MESATIYTILVLVGLCLGSFAGATTWRLRARQLASDRVHHEDYDKNEYKKLKKLLQANIGQDRSRCLHCSYTLRWYDLIPLVSWLALKGKCRQCRRGIGALEPLIELGMALFFVTSYTFWPYSFDTTFATTQFIIWLIAGVGLGILFVYDTKWFLLPDKVTISAIALGSIVSTLIILQSSDMLGTLFSIIGSVITLSGLYAILYIGSRGRWIGFGDVKLGLGLALLLGNWQLAFVALFAANLIGCLLVLPAMARGKLRRDSHVPFGPLLILGAIVAQLAGPYLVDVYLSTVLL